MSRYVDVSSTFLYWHGSPTGVQRVIQGISRAAEKSGFGLAVFHPSLECWYEIPSSVMLATFEPDVFVRSNRRLKSVLARMKSLEPLYRGLLHRLGMWLGRRSRERLLVRAGEPIRFHSGDRLVIMDDCWSIDPYLASLQGLRASVPGLEIVGFIYDVTPLSHPQFSDPAMSLRFRTWIEGLLRVSSFTLTDSRHAADEIVRFFEGRESPNGGFELRLPAGELVYHQAAPRSVRFGSKLNQSTAVHPDATVEDLIGQIRALGLQLSEEQVASLRRSQGWLLCLGTLHPRKNLGVQLDALEPLWQEGKITHPLFWVGRTGPDMEDVLRRAIESPVLRSKLIILRSAPDPLVSTLFSGAHFSLYTSWTEGFGLPVSESLQQGCPVIASSGGAIPEVAGDLVDYFDPSDSKGLQELILKYLDDGNEYEKVRQRMRSFVPYSWEDTLEDIAKSR